MIFDKLVIKNFRSFDSSGETIYFSSNENLYALVGQNSAGKSNILDALSLVLENYKSEWSEEKITKSDFFQEKLFDDKGNPIILQIELYFNDNHFKVENVNKFITKSTHTVIKGIRFSAKVREMGEEKETIKWDNICFGDDDKNIGATTKNWSKADPPLSEEDTVIERGFELLRASVLIKKLPKSYFLNIEGLKGFLKLTGYAPLARILDLYKNDLRTNTENISLPTGQIVESKKTNKKYQELENQQRGQAISKWANSLVDLLRTDLLKKIEDKLGEKTAKYIGLSSKNLKTQFGAINVTEIVDKILELKIKDSSNIYLPVTKQGQGYLSLLRLAVLETLKELREIPPSILFIEEPEIYLHPSLQRHCFKLLIDLASNGYQIFYATHSPELLSLEKYTNVIRVNKTGSLTSTKKLSDDLSLNFSKVDRKLLEKGNREIFFSNAVILTEGKGDQIALKIFLEKRGIFYDLESIFIADCGSKDNIPDYIKLCIGLDIPFFIVHDTDLDDRGNQQEETKKFVENIKKILEDNNKKYKDIAYAFPDKLEKSLGLESKKDYKIIECLEPKSYQQICKDYPDFKNAYDKINLFLGYKNAN